MSLSTGTIVPPYVFESFDGTVPAHLPPYSVDSNQRAEADRQLMQSLGPAPLAHPESGPGSLFNVPPHSTLGLWLSQLDSALRHPDFKRWMQARNLSTANLQFDPGTQSLQGYVDGQPVTFTLSDDSGFASVAGPLIQAVRSLGFWPASSGRFLDYPSKPYNVAHFRDVLRFYAVEPADSLHGDAALAEQQRAVGDSHDRHQLIASLTRLMAAAPQPQDFARQLHATKLQVHPGSSYSQAHVAGETATVRVAPFLRACGVPVPNSLKALKRLIQRLSDSPLEQALAARSKTRYTELMRATHQALPKLRDEAKRWAEDVIFKLTGTHVDADTLYLNRFKQAQSANTATGWAHTGEEPTLSQQLPDALLSNFNEHDWLPGVLDQEAGLYTKGAGQGDYGAHNQFPLAPSRVMHESWKTDFQQRISAKLQAFWRDHGSDYRTTLKGEFIRRAREQFNTPSAHQLSADDYRLVMGAASNVPLDANQPLTLEQLQAETPAKGHVFAHRLDINGFPATDILRFTAPDGRQVGERRDGVQILYIPGHQPAFLRFDGLAELDQWIAEQGRDPAKRKALASHFALRDRQDGNTRFWSDIAINLIPGLGPGLGLLPPGQRVEHKEDKGVDTALAYLGSGYWDKHEGTIIDSANIREQGDVFSAVQEATRRRMARDADVVIKSNSEVTRDTWLNDLTAAADLAAKFALIGEPLVVGTAVVLGIAETVVGGEKASSGDSAAERADGRTRALDGALNTLFSALGGTLADDPLEVPSTLPLHTEVFADGQQAKVLEHALGPGAYSLPRAKGYDVVDADKVYRYRTARPGELRDIDTQALDDFAAICPAPGTGTRVRRGANDACFAKLIDDLPGSAAHLQALEHVRLFPSTAGLFTRERLVVYEKRLHRMLDTETGPRLVPVADAERVTYKLKVRGTLVDDPGFGFYSADWGGALEKHTRVVKLGRISEASNDQRQVRGVVVNSGGRPYLVVEADTAEFYYAPLDKPHKGELVFKKCSPAELNLVQGYRAFLRAHHAGNLDPGLIALPKLKDAYRQLEASGYTKADVDELKQLCADLNEEQQREVAYQLQRSKALHAPDIALHPRQVSALEKPPGFADWPAKRQNQFYAEHAKHAVDQALKATGLGPGNQVRSAKDLARADAASMTVQWLRRTADLRAPNAGDLILKTGAGNCGEMALLARRIINQSGGAAVEWDAGDLHTFTVIGGPSTPTVDFAGPAWADAWVVDPWAGIACPAADYTRQLKATLVEWDKAGVKIREGRRSGVSPLDPQWLDTLIEQPKRPGGTAFAADDPLPVLAPVPPKPATMVHVAMGEATTLSSGNDSLSTRSLSDCSALAVLTDWNGTTYQTRTLLHLTGSNLEYGLFNGSTKAVLDKLQASLHNGGRVIFVGGVDTQSTQGMATVIGQTFHGRQPLLELLKERPGVTVTIAGAPGVTVRADGSFDLLAPKARGVFTPQMIQQVLERID